MSKLDVGILIKDHLDTLTDYGTGKKSIRDYVFFFVLPVVFAVGLVCEGVLLVAGSITVLITALSIFAGLLLNLLLLTHGILTSRGGDEKSNRRRCLISQIYKNISYAILVSLGTVVVLIIVAVVPVYAVVLAGSAVGFAMVGNFVLTLLMILKRVHVMLGKEHESAGEK